MPATDLVSLPARLLAVAGSVVRGLKIQFIEPLHRRSRSDTGRSSQYTLERDRSKGSACFTTLTTANL